MTENEFYAALEVAGHLLLRNDDGSVEYCDAGDYHGGPQCELCRHTWCQHCENEIETCTNASIESTCEIVREPLALADQGAGEKV